MRKQTGVTATHLKAVLEHQGVPQAWLAEQIGVDGTTMNKVVKGTRTLPPAKAKEVADLLRLPVGLLFAFPTGTTFVPTPEGAS